jgi:hypothetical protein
MSSARVSPVVIAELVAIINLVVYWLLDIILLLSKLT